MALVSKTFSQIVTFTRASTATFVGSNGLIQSAAIDAPRFDYDPVTLAAKGLLVEESSTNELANSVETGSSFVDNNTTRTANAATAPDGTSTAATLAASDTTTNAVHFARTNGSPLASVTVTATVSVFVKKSIGYDYVWVIGLGGNVTSSPRAGIRINLNTGAFVDSIANTNTLDAYSITNAGSGWWRVSVTTTATTNTNGLKVVVGLTPDNTTGWTSSWTAASTANNVLYWGAQIEQKAFPTSYIPTSGTAATRAADSALINTLSPWFNATEGTLYGQFDSVASGTRTVTAINDGTSNESIRLRTVSTDPFFTVTDGGVDQANIDAGTVASYTSYKFAGAYKANDFATCINAGTVQTDLSGTLPTVTQMMLGTSAAANYLNGHLQRVTYYPRRLSDAELQTITT